MSFPGSVVSAENLRAFFFLVDQQVIERPRYEDLELQYHDKNPWACLGMGWTVENRKGVENADCSPYLNINNIDPKWHEANGGDPEVLKKQVNEYNMRK